MYIGSHLICWVEKVPRCFCGFKIELVLPLQIPFISIIFNILCTYGASFSAKNIAYKCLVRPNLEYTCPVWSPFTKIKLVQRIYNYINGPSHQMIVPVNCNGHPYSLKDHSCHCHFYMISGRDVLE